LKSALLLAYKLTGIQPNVLESQYRKACSKEDDTFRCLLEQEFEDEEGMEDPAVHPARVSSDQDEGMSCADTIRHVQEEAAFMAQDDEAASNVDSFDVDTKLPDWELLKDLLERDNAEAPFKKDMTGSPEKSAPASDRLPSTLREALSWVDANNSNLFNVLFRLAVRIRSSKGGCDSGWLKNPRSCRQVSHGLNWHQCLACQLAWRKRLVFNVLFKELSISLSKSTVDIFQKNPNSRQPFL